MCICALFYKYVCIRKPTLQYDRIFLPPASGRCVHVKIEKCKIGGCHMVATEPPPTWSPHVQIGLPHLRHALPGTEATLPTKVFGQNTERPVIVESALEQLAHKGAALD